MSKENNFYKIAVSNSEREHCSYKFYNDPMSYRSIVNLYIECNK